MSTMTKRILWTACAFACAVLAFSAVWMGGLNQDEGWYLYAANLVSKGEVPYRDFFFTQGPVMPFVYGAFAWIWRTFGLVGARVFTLALGLVGVVFACALAARLAPQACRGEAALATALILGGNVFHLYYLAIPKTYALVSLFLAAGFFLLTVAVSRATEGVRARTAPLACAAGVALALACGARISMGAALAAAGLWLLATRRFRLAIAFALGGAVTLALVYGPFLADPSARAGLAAAQAYHAARGGFDPVWTLGSLSRLVRWYLPVFVLIGLVLFAPRRQANAPTGGSARTLPLWGFLAVFLVQIAAPFPYEDYQVPIMGLLAAFAVAALLDSESGIAARPGLLALLALGMTWAGTFGSPLFEKWMTDGQDRFWSIKKDATEMALLRDAARRIERADPRGKTLLTQDLYLAIETNREVPKGLEMGPFAMLTDAQWAALVESAPCRLAALSGYTFAVKPPVCAERPVDEQMDLWHRVKKHYRLLDKMERFGQNATTLMLLERKQDGK